MKKRCRFQTQDLAYLTKIIEGFEGLAIVKTIHGKDGIVEFVVPDDQKSLFSRVLKTLDIAYIDID